MSHLKKSKMEIIGLEIVSEDVEQLDALHIAGSVKISKGEPHNGSGGQKGSS